MNRSMSSHEFSRPDNAGSLSTSSTDVNSGQGSLKSRVDLKSLPQGLSYSEFRSLYLNAVEPDLQSSQKSSPQSASVDLNANHTHLRTSPPPLHTGPSQSLYPASPNGVPSAFTNPTRAPRRARPSRLRLFFSGVWNALVIHFTFGEFMRRLIQSLLVTLMFTPTFSFTHFAWIFGAHIVVTLGFIVHQTVVALFFSRRNGHRPSYAAIIVRKMMPTVVSQRPDTGNTTPELPTLTTSTATQKAVDDFYPVGNAAEESARTMAGERSDLQAGNSVHVDGGERSSTTLEDSSTTDSSAPTREEAHQQSPVASPPQASIPDYSPEDQLSTPSRPLILLYCILRCIEVFFLSLSPFFSIEEFEESLRADGILHFSY